MSTNVTVHHGVGGQPRRRAIGRWTIGRWTKGFRAFYASLLVAAVVASLLPAVLFQANSRVFLLKLVAVAILASMPGLLYLEFIRFKGQSLYDEYVINLFRPGSTPQPTCPRRPSTPTTSASGARPTTT